MHTLAPRHNIMAAQALCQYCLTTPGCGVGIRVLVRSWSLSVEGDSDSGPYLCYLHLHSAVAVYLTLCNLFCN